MKIAVFKKLFAIYRDQIGQSFPKVDGFRVLTMLAACQEGPLSPAQVIERTGFSQSDVSKLLKKFGTAGIIEVNGTRKRYDQAFVLTTKGRELTTQFEDVVGKLLLEELKDDPAKDDELRNAEPIVRAFAEKYPERYAAHKGREERRAKLHR